MRLPKLLVWGLAVLLTMLALGYDLMWARQQKTHSRRLDQAVTHVMDTLSSDPKNIVVGSLLAKKERPNIQDASLYVDYLQQGLNVGRKGMTCHG